MGWTPSTVTPRRNPGKLTREVLKLYFDRFGDRLTVRSLELIEESSVPTNFTSSS